MKYTWRHDGKYLFWGWTDRKLKKEKEEIQGCILIYSMQAQEIFKKHFHNCLWIACSCGKNIYEFGARINEIIIDQLVVSTFGQDLLQKLQIENALNLEEAGLNVKNLNWWRAKELDGLQGMLEDPSLSNR